MVNQIKTNRRIQIQTTGKAQGTGYHTEFRKDVATRISKGITHRQQLRYDTNTLVMDMLKAGIQLQTLRNWVKKYTGIDFFFVYSGKRYWGFAEEDRELFWNDKMGGNTPCAA